MYTHHITCVYDIHMYFVCGCWCVGECMREPSRWRSWLAGVWEDVGNTRVSSQFWVSVAELLLCAMWHLCTASCLSSICINGEMDPSPAFLSPSHMHTHTSSPFTTAFIAAKLQQQATLWLLIACKEKDFVFWSKACLQFFCDWPTFTGRAGID